ncbi:uncharacterized protein LOC122252969 [Penaeus japonicus]|uniref:uncharacterized protein LOC122252969 n=1 Tax=Penaeus japonicus TaxID=27405 RepID=UPI001C716EF7|nr:uncharacterized protein LOC122252969 [Penaeus japonicus]
MRMQFPLAMSAQQELQQCWQQEAFHFSWESEDTPPSGNVCSTAGASAVMAAGSLSGESEYTPPSGNVRTGPSPGMMAAESLVGDSEDAPSGNVGTAEASAVMEAGTLSRESEDSMISRKDGSRIIRITLLSLGGCL